MAQMLNAIVCLRTPLFVLAIMFLMVGPIRTSAVGEEISKGNVTWGIGWIGDGRDGALILDVVPKGPADKLGLVPGDVIRSVNGHLVRNSAELKERIKNSRPYSLVRIVVLRFGERLEKNLLPTGVLRLEVKNLDRTYRSFKIPGVPKTVFTSPSTTLEALDNVNVLQNVIIDRKSGQIAVMGIYDPKYATGPIPYLDLLKTALKFSNPGLNLKPVGEVKTYLEIITPWQFFEEVLGSSGTERERQLLIREMASAYGLSREEFVRLYNYAYLDGGRELAPAEIGRILIKAFRHLGSNEVANAYERLAGNTVDDFMQALNILNSERKLEQFTGGKQLANDQLLAFTCIAMLEALFLPGDEIQDLLSKVHAEQIGSAEILQRMYKYSALYMYDPAGAKKEAAQAADPKTTIAVSRPIWRTGPKLGLVKGDPASAPLSGDEGLVRIETVDIDANSQLARIMYEADYALKAESTTDLFENIPGHMTFAEHLSRAHSELSSSAISYSNNLWFEPKRIELQISTDKSVVTFGAAEMLLRSGYKVHAASPQDEKILIQSFAAVATHVTDNYDLYAQAMPAWHALREGAKVIALARWLKQNRISVTLDSVRQERWDNPGKVPGFWDRYFIYYRNTSEDASGDRLFNYLIGTGYFGGVNFTSSKWTSYGPASKTTETKVPDQLVLSSQLGQKAAQAANAGNLESARHLAELSAQALTGHVTRGELAKQNITLPSARTAPLSPARVQLQKQLLKETHNQISALRQNPANAQATANLTQIGSVYEQVQSKPAAASDYLIKLQTRQLLSSVPTRPSSSTEFPAHTPIAATCETILHKIAMYQDALQQAVEVANRLSRSVSDEQRRRDEWEKTMRDAFERIKDRATSLALELLIGKLRDNNKAELEAINKNGADLADRLSSTADEMTRYHVRIARQYLAEARSAKKEVATALEIFDYGTQLEGVRTAEQSPTSPFNSTGMRVRNALELAYNILDDHPRWSAPIKNLLPVVGIAFKTEAITRAVLDSAFDGLALKYSWDRLTEMNLNFEQYVEASKKLQDQIRKRGARLKDAEKLFAEECS